MGTTKFRTIWYALALSTSASATKFSEYILAPNYRSVTPPSLLTVRGSVQNPDALCTNVHNSQGAIFSGVNSSITLDFGINIGGTVDFDVRSVSGFDEYVGFTFTESSMWISPYESDSASNATFDSPLWFKIPSKGKYTAEKEHQRGGFRYLSIWHNSTGSVTIGDFAVNFTASPEMQDLRHYPGYFNSDNEKLNRVWYAGAYTNQLCSMDPAYGNALGIPGTDWYYNATVANGTSVLIDGAKRDRLVWPGDIAISGPSIFVSTNSLDGIKNGIDSIFVLQQADGRLPWAGTPFTGPGRFPFSFTYHLYTLLDLYYYYTYTGDLEYLIGYWDQHKLALSWSLGTIDSSGLANVSSTNDWLRSGMGGHNIEANSIFYHVLDLSLKLAEAIGDTSEMNTWTAAMARIKISANKLLWDPAQSLYFDNDTATTLHPQDGNSWAVIAGIADAARASAISTSLAARWIRPYGAPAPEAGSTISPFASGFEVQAHYLAGHPELAEDLISFMWADFMLDDPRMTNSSFIEGYSTNGDLHYSPYSNDARVSHAHGWSTGPTSALTFYGAGLQLTSAMGKTWLVQPRLGSLNRVTAGYETSLGQFSATWAMAGGNVLTGSFATPSESTGTLIVPRGNGKLTVSGPFGRVSPSNETSDALVFLNLPGGGYKIWSS
ncbi:alpha-L-rhamnosidase [Rhexocercosporidium sp. MPI-PUGE-AT-0058]|nr:alpha-L-rhamnosidase [Rhexocercosporidium sp. MPI-PUGE-AT-0058]